MPAVWNRGTKTAVWIRDATSGFRPCEVGMKLTTRLHNKNIYRIHVLSSGDLLKYLITNKSRDFIPKRTRKDFKRSLTKCQDYMLSLKRPALHQVDLKRPNWSIKLLSGWKKNCNSPSHSVRPKFSKKLLYSFSVFHLTPYSTTIGSWNGLLRVEKPRSSHGMD